MNIAVRELKDHLSEYLKRAAAGEDFLVTSHGKAVARLTSLLPERQDTEAEAIARLQQQPWIIPARKKGSFPVGKTVISSKSNEKLMSDVVLGMRE